MFALKPYEDKVPVMQREAWTYSMTATVLGAFGVLLRWLQCEIIFDDVTGLPIKNAPVSYFLVLFLLAVAAGLWWLSGRMSVRRSSQEPEEALSQPNREVGVLLGVAAAAVAVGAIWMFLKEINTLMRVTALLGLLSAPVLAMMPSLPRWGGFGALLSLIPVVFFSLWIVMFYKENAVNPIVWEYGVQMLAIAAGLLAAYRLCGYLFYRINARRTVFSCALALTVCLTVLMDQASMGERIMFAGWGIGYGTLCWVLLNNFLPADGTEEEE